MAIPKCTTPISKNSEDTKKEQKALAKSLIANPSSIKAFLDQKIQEAGGIEGIMAKAKAEGKKNLISKTEKTEKVGSVFLLPENYYDVTKVMCSNIGSNFFWEERNYKIKAYDDGDAYVDVGKDRRVIKVTYRIEDPNPPKNYQEEMMKLKKSSGNPSLFNKIANDIEKFFKDVDDKVSDYVEKIRKDEGNVPRDPESNVEPTGNFQEQFQKDLAAFQAQGGALGPVQRSMQSGTLSKLGPFGQAIGGVITGAAGANGIGSTNTGVTSLSGTSLTSQLTGSGTFPGVGSLSFNDLLKKAQENPATTKTVIKTTPTVTNNDSVNIPDENPTIIEVSITTTGNFFSSTRDYVYDAEENVVTLTKNKVPEKMKVKYSIEEPIPEAVPAAQTLPDAPLDICSHIPRLQIKPVETIQKDENGNNIVVTDFFKKVISKQVNKPTAKPEKKPTIQEQTTIVSSSESKASDVVPNASIPLFPWEEPRYSTLDAEPATTTTTAAATPATTPPPPPAPAPPPEPVPPPITETLKITLSKKEVEEKWAEARKAAVGPWLDSLSQYTSPLFTKYTDVNGNVLASYDNFNKWSGSTFIEKDTYTKISAFAEKEGGSLFDNKFVVLNILPNLSEEDRTFYEDFLLAEMEHARVRHEANLLRMCLSVYASELGDIMGNQLPAGMSPKKVPQFNITIRTFQQSIENADKRTNGNFISRYDNGGLQLSIDSYIGPGSIEGDAWKGTRNSPSRPENVMTDFLHKRTGHDEAFFSYYEFLNQKDSVFTEDNSTRFFHDTLPSCVSKLKDYSDVIQQREAINGYNGGLKWFSESDFKVA